MVSWVLVAIGTLASFFASGSAVVKKCDEEFIGKIRDFWKTNGDPDEIKHETSGREYVLRSTPGYYDGEILCAFTELDSDMLKLITVGATEKSQKSLDPPQVKNGISEETGNSPKRVYIYNKDGITVLYRCSEKGVEAGVEVALKVKPNFNADEIETKVPEVIKKVKDQLNIDLSSREYAYNCEKPEEVHSNQESGKTSEKPEDLQEAGKGQEKA